MYSKKNIESMSGQFSNIVGVSFYILVCNKWNCKIEKKSAPICSNKREVLAICNDVIPVFFIF